MDILEQIEFMISQTKNSTRGYDHAQIFEVLERKIDVLKVDLMIKEYKRQLAEQDQTA